MYRAYQPLFPAASRYLQEKWDKTNYQEHRRKVQLAVPVVNTTAPPTPLHLQVNLKRMQLEKERQAVRDRDNLLHYARLVGIEQSRGRVDNWNFYCRHSLNWEKRRQDHKQIFWENQQLLKRLGEKKSELAQGPWQQDWNREQVIQNQLARYPRGIRSSQVVKISVASLRMCSPHVCMHRRPVNKQWLQAGTERQRQRTVDSRSPASVCEGNASSPPNRTRFPGSGTRTGLMGERFQGRRSKPAPEAEETTSTFPPYFLRKAHVTQESGPIAQQASSGTLVSAEEADGSSARADLLGGASLEKPIVEAAMAPAKPAPSSCLRKKLRFSEKNPTSALKIRELSAKHRGPGNRRAEKDSKSDG